MEQDELVAFNALTRKYSDCSILMHEAIARRAGLAGTDHKYLGLLLEKGEMTAGELSKHTGLTTGAVTAMIDRLERKKLVKRAHDKDDRRKVLIVPNQKAIMDLLQPLFKELQKKTVTLIDSFTAKDRKVLQRYFAGAVEIMTEVTDQLNNI